MTGERTGFTLIEVLVALGVSAVILAIGAASLDTVMAGQQQSERQADDVRRGHRLELAFADDVKHLRMLRNDSPFVRKVGTVAGMRADAVSFTRSGGMVAEWATKATERESPESPRWVAYVCREEAGGLTLYRVETRPQSTRGVAVPVLRGLSEFAVSAFDQGQEEWSAKDGVPAEVRVRVVFKDGVGTNFSCLPAVTDVAEGLE